MTERACHRAALGKQGLRRGTTNLGAGDRLVLPEGALYRAFGRELAARLDQRRRADGSGSCEEEGDHSRGDDSSPQQ